VFGLDTVREQRSWPDEYIPRVRLLGEVLVSALARRNDRLQLDEQLKFEMLLADISGRFINLPVDRVDGEIEDAQRLVCECLGLDLSVLWKWSDEIPRILTMTHLYRPLGGPPPPEPMFAHEYFPWSQEQVEAGRIITISSLEDYPADAARDKETNLHFGVKSNLTLPLSIGGNPPVGVLTFNTMQAERSWPEDLIARLKMVAQIFTNALVRKQNETALRESEARLSLTTEAVGAGLWIMDVATGKVWNSSKNRELFHFTTDEELSYESFFRVIHPEDRGRVHQEVQRSLQSGENLLCDYRIVLPEGSVRWIVSRGQRYLKPNGAPDRIMGLSLDITERKEMELKLSESQTLLSSLVNSTSDLIWSVDAERFGLLTFNRALTEYFLNNHGINIRIGMSPEELLPADFARHWHSFYRKALEKGPFTTEYQTSGGGRVLRLSINSLRQNGLLFGVSVFAQDITELKRLEEQLRQSLDQVQQLRDRLQTENVYLREEVKLLYKHTEIVGDSTPIKAVLAQAEQVSATDSTVLILGETGTGKELLARAIHDTSKRKDRTLVMVNCASLPPTLIESELFGREKGAYTGSLTKMIGRFELADGSTLFLDEIGELPLELQSKLLRVLEHGQFERLGSSRTIKVDVRLIAATNRDLARDVNEGRFRKDLYYRLNVFPITVPPLRDRKGDIPQLVWSFVRQFEKSLGKHIDSIPRKNMEALMSYPWPGNIRELRNVIEHAMIMNKGKTLDVEPPACERQEPSGASTLEDMERRHITEVLERTGWRISGKNGASEILGMKRTTLQSKMKALGISRPISS
jgi:PAS domain S-box-containing protein